MARSSGAIATGTTRRADPVEVESLEPLKVLIWAKTYPELSKRHRETVCTGGCPEDGTPIRLYPVPLRYLPVTSQYRLYDWISVPLRRNSMDTRPESFRVAQGVMPTTVGKARTTHGWEARREVVFKRQDWHFDCALDLHAAQERAGTSLGLVAVRDVDRVSVSSRPDSDRVEHQARLRTLRANRDLFGGAGIQKDLEFLPWRFKLWWRCEAKGCDGHSGSVLDWGLGELARREGPDSAEAKLRELTDLGRYDLRLFLGNMKMRPRTFSIVGLWHPLRSEQAQLSLFID